VSGRKAVVTDAMNVLREREHHIIVERRLKDSPPTLKRLAEQYGISRELVRQIEVRALAKLQKR
jgi:RNA polymerase sigma-32 factor